MASAEPPDGPKTSAHATRSGVDLDSWRASLRAQRRRRAVLLLGLVVLAALWLSRPWRTRTANEVSYLHYTLGTADRHDTLPLIVALHGLGDTPEGFAAAYRGLDVTARLVLPAGFDDYVIGRSWYPMETDDAALHRAGDRLATFVETLTTRHPTRGKPIVTGFSQGGIMSFELAARHPDAIGAAVPVAGGLVVELAPGVSLPADVPIRALHGLDDTRIEASWGESSIEHLRSRGADATYRGFDGIGHQITGPMFEAYHAVLREAVEAIP